MTEYMDRIIDKEIIRALDAMGAVLIEGPKWCGKTTSAIHHSKSFVKMQDPQEMLNNRRMAETAPSLLLEGEKPRLIDEWQTAPILWDAIRVDVDNTGLRGQYILTGSSTPFEGATMHTGTGRIARIKMYPMSLYESGDSQGIVSLHSLFKNKDFVASSIESNIKNIAMLICRGGFPQNAKSTLENSLYTMRQYVQSIYNNDINVVNGPKTDPVRLEAFLKSYSRHVQTTATYKTILDDLKPNDVSINRETINSYMEKMNSLYIIDETLAWSPNIRSRTAIRTSNKRGFIDSSIPVAILNINPDKLLKDFNTFGLLFESMCMRDLKIYSRAIGANVLHYRDDYGLECDAIITLPSGEYGLIEIKLGGEQEDKAAESLLKLENLLQSKGSKPNFKMILTGGQYAYKRADGIFVVPITALKD